MSEVLGCHTKSPGKPCQRVNSPEKRPFCLRRGCRRESFIHESTNSLLTTLLCCNAVNSLNQPKFQRGKGPGSGFIRLSMMSERRHGEQRPCRVCRAGLTAPIVSRVIPTPADSPRLLQLQRSARGGETLLPNSWGTSRERSEGRRGAAPLVSIHP